MHTNSMHILEAVTCLLFSFSSISHAFVTTTRNDRVRSPGILAFDRANLCTGLRKRSQRRDLVRPLKASKVLSSMEASVKSYEYDGWQLTYEYKPASKGYEKETPLLLIHPVGIGLSSWYWERFMNAWQGPALYAVDLIGCGIRHGADAWDPNVRGLSVPLGWVQGCEALLQKAIFPKQQKIPFMKRPQCNVMVQGGLAPVGVLLAFRNPETVQRLILASPPTWKDMTTPVPEKELERNYNFLRSPILGKLAFGLLESRWAVEFFSNAFLFADKCDAEWLDQAQAEACVEARPPVQVFNAGFCMHRSYEEELQSLQQPVLVLQGVDDASRLSKREDYASELMKGSVQTLAGKNVLPWESPTLTCQAVNNFCGL